MVPLYGSVPVSAITWHHVCVSKVPHVYQERCKSQHLSWSEGALVPTAWVTCICVPLMWRPIIEILERHMLPSRSHLFQEHPRLFQKDSAKPHSAHATTMWLRRYRVRVFDWPACSLDLSSVANIWHIIRRTVQQLQSGIKQGHISKQRLRHQSAYLWPFNLTAFCKLAFIGIKLFRCLVSISNTVNNSEIGRAHD